MKRIILYTAAFAFIIFAEAFAGGGDVKKHSTDRVVKNLISGLNSGNRGVVVSCALTVGEYGFLEATDKLSEILNSDADMDTRFAAMIALYKIKTAPAVKELKYAASNLGDAYLRSIAEVLYTDIMRDKDAEEKYEITVR